MKKTFFIATSMLLLSACGDSSSSWNRSEDEASTSSQEESNEEITSLASVKAGSRGTCLALDFPTLSCAPKAEDLKNESARLRTINVPMQNFSNAVTPVYTITEEDENLFDLQELTENLQATNKDNYDYTLYQNVTAQPDDLYGFLGTVSATKGQIDASGEIIKYSMNMNDVSVPVTYAVDCTEDATTFHLVTGDYGIKVKYSETDKDNQIYEVSTTEMDKERKELETETLFCSPNTTAGPIIAEEETQTPEPQVDDNVTTETPNSDLTNTTEPNAATEAEEAAQAIGEAINESGEAINQGAKQAGDALVDGLEATESAVERGVENAAESVREVTQDIDAAAKEAGENVKEGADQAAETVADGLENVDEVLDEGAAVIEGTANAVAEEVQETTEAARDEINQEIDEVRQEQQVEEQNQAEEEEGGFFNWLRNLFN